MPFLLFLLTLLAISHTGSAYSGTRELIKVRYMDAVPLKEAKGACPNIHYGKYNFNRPYAASLKRGGMLRINGYRNDFVGGFIRFSMVPVHDAFKKKAHDESAFLYTCADTYPRRCNSLFRDICRLDRKNEHYTYYIKIPEIYTDGYYSLSITRYGSFSAYLLPRKGAFQDYIGCLRIRIRGGPIAFSYMPRFHPGPTITGGGGYCRAILDSVDDVFYGHREQKTPVLLKPVEFTNGKLKPIVKKPFTSYYGPRW